MRAPRNIKATCAYDGSLFLGWQNSVEAAIASPLAQILQHPVCLQAASRTDSGVHAKSQVFNFFTHKPISLGALHRSLRSLLPKEIALFSLEEAPMGFHPTLDCIKKEYRYFLCNDEQQLPWKRSTSWHYPRPLDLSLMRKAAAHFVGTHDFSSLCNQKQREHYEHKVRTLYRVEILDDYTFILIGNGFLYKMARNIVGTLVYVGRGRIAAEAIPELLRAKDRKKMGVSAPAHGLFLYKVYYDSAQ